MKNQPSKSRGLSHPYSGWQWADGHHHHDPVQTNCGRRSPLVPHVICPPRSRMAGRGTCAALLDWLVLKAHSRWPGSPSSPPSCSSLPLRLWGPSSRPASTSGCSKKLRRCRALASEDDSGSEASSSSESESLDAIRDSVAKKKGCRERDEEKQIKNTETTDQNPEDRHSEQKLVWWPRLSHLGLKHHPSLLSHTGCPWGRRSPTQ